MISNIIFDMGGVLIEWNPEEFVKRRNLNKEDADIILENVYHSKNWSLHDEGVLNGKEYEEAITSSVPERLKEEALWTINHWTDISKPIEGMHDLLKELKEEGYHLYLLSNAGSEQPQYFKKYGYNEYFDGLYVSALHHLIKPDTLIFESIVKEYGLNKEECIFIDDMLENCKACETTGIKTIVFKDINKLKEDIELYR